MKKAQRSSFKLNPVAAAIAIAMTSQFVAGAAHAGSGYGSGIDITGMPMTVQTYYANSPVGPVPAIDPVTGTTTIIPKTGRPVMADSGKALRKFVDTLPGIGAAKANNLGQYLPVAVPEKWVDLNGVATNDDYYEIAAIEYSEKMHSDLPKATHLRGYVQLSTPKNPGLHIALTYPNGSPILDANGVQVYAYDKPHHLGPIINATKGTAVRIKFTNYLPVGGELFLPVDTTITGAGVGPDGVTKYTQNRAQIHLYGGNAPWVSAGSPHQWVAPAGEAAAYAAGMGKGASAQNVPDMADPGPGSNTLYFPNDVSARFMFYQDRTSGLTRLNSYAGLEAGYFVTDAAEQALIANGTIPADQIPLIIEDKTFVPQNIAQQDAKWDTAFWGQPGDLWYPHVYEPNQDPNSINAASPVGRWDYGPLFWPIFPATQVMPTGVHGDAAFVPDAFFDTPLVNGTAYPTLTVDPKAYRFRILNASNDRTLNLSLFKADPATLAPQLDKNGNPIVDATGVQQYFTNTEVKMVPAMPDAAGNPPGWDAASGVQLPLRQYPNLKFVNNVESSGPSRAWPVDARPGGTPDPTMAGPDFIAIGNDGGLLPNPVDVPAQPVTYEANRRSITIGNVYCYGMYMGPAERADAIVDFSAYAGQTLILYNDGPAPNPWHDERNDYYTGNQDLTASGGTYTTLPGYGPNTRTIMQIKVNAAPAGTTPTPFNADALVTALPAAYAASQAMPIVPATAYNNAFGTNDTDIYAHVATGSLAQPTLDFSTGAGGAVILTGLTLISSGGPTTGSGSGYDPLNPPTVVFNNTVNGVSCLSAGGTSASATAVVDPVTLQVTGITNFNAGAGYTCAPTVTFSSKVGVGAQASVNSTNLNSIPVFTKAEQELFDNAGRYNFTGGVELPFTNATTQTTIPLSYYDSPTDVIGDNEVQIWKIVDNGFWTNSMHFDMVEVQIVNRVGWDGTVKPPSSNELGWKDTLRLNQLEDLIVAMRAKRPTIPFGLPKSSRAQDPSVALGSKASGLNFMADPGVVDPAGKALLTTLVNVTADYDNEFVWNSANLSHSENDFIRPLVYRPTVVKPAAPSNLADTTGSGTMTWSDPTPAGAATTIANAQNEIGFKVLKASVDANGNAGVFTQVATVPANVTHWTEPAPAPNMAYEVVAYNAAGDSDPSLSYVAMAPVAPTALTANPVAYNSVTLGWGAAQTATKLEVWRNGVLIATLAGNATGFVDDAASAALYKYAPAVSALMTYNYEIKAVNAMGSASATLTVTTPMQPVAAPTGLTATPNAGGTQVALRWTDAANNETAYWVEVSTDGGATYAAPVVINRTAAQKAATGGIVAYNAVTVPGSVYTFRVTAINVTGAATSKSVPAVVVANLAAPVAPAAPGNLVGTLASATRVTLTWLDNANNENSYLVTITNNTTGAVTTATVNRTAAQSLSTGTNVTYNAAVVAGNNYSFSVVARATRFGLTTVSAAAGPVTVDVSAPVAPTTVAAAAGAAGSRSVTVTWVDAPLNARNYTVQRATVSAAGVVGAFANVGTVNPGVQTFVNTGLTIGRTYVYQVRANGAVGNSAFVQSNQVVAQ